MKVSHIVCTNTQLLLQIKEAYAFYKLTLRIMDLLDKIKVTPLIKKFCAFYGTRRFIPSFSIAAKSFHPQSNQSGPLRQEVTSNSWHLK
jgi:hypothetical protein